MPGRDLLIGGRNHVLALPGRYHFARQLRERRVLYSLPWRNLQCGGLRLFALHEPDLLWCGRDCVLVVPSLHFRLSQISDLHSLYRHVLHTL